MIFVFMRQLKVSNTHFVDKRGNQEAQRVATFNQNLWQLSSECAFMVATGSPPFGISI